MIKEIISTVTSKGQVTIPAEIRRHLGVATNTKLAFVITGEGLVEIRAPRYPDIKSLRGAAGSLKKEIEWHEMREIARQDEVVRRAVPNSR